MKKTSFLFYIFSFFALTYIAFAAPTDSPAGNPQPKVTTSAPAMLIAASATSYSDDSSPIACLLDPDCKGFWSPKSKDGGESEGIYLQFKDPVPLDFIEIIAMEKDPVHLFFQVYLDAKTSEGKKTLAKNATAPAGRKQIEPARTEGGTEKADKKFIYTSYRDIIDPTGQYAKRTRYITSGLDDVALGHTAKSVFIKIARADNSSPPPRILSIRFLDGKDYGEALTPKAIILPLSLPATVFATSTLAPTFAYDASHLFDSQMDMAWATDGKNSKGVGESVTVRFSEAQRIGALMLWNGYQRSVTHYNANARVKRLSINGVAKELLAQDKQGMQIIPLPQPIHEKDVTLTITDIYPGSKYKDVLLSELRFVQTDGTILLPQVAPQKIATPPAIAPLLDATYSRFILETIIDSADDNPSEFFSGCPRASLRLRSNGNFVIYKTDLISQKDDNAQKMESSVIEGNWEPLAANSVRLFGKKYPVAVNSNEAEYLPLPDSEQPAASLREPRIFQSVLTMTPYNSLSAVEQKNALLFTTKAVFTASPKDQPPPKNKRITILLSLNTMTEAAEDTATFSGKSMDEALQVLHEKMKNLNPLYVQSDVYTDLLLPRTKVGECSEGP